MMDAGFTTQLGAFLGDLRFLACGCSLVLYALWLASRRSSLLNMGRLGLVVAFGTTVIAYALGGVALTGLPFADFFLFILLATFLLMEFLFQMSILGVGVAAAGTAIAALHYFVRGQLTTLHPLTSLQAYWWLLRDIVGTTGTAAAALGLSTALLLYAQPERRTGQRRVHPNDLRDMISLLARGALPCFFFAVICEGVSLFRQPLLRWGDFYSLAAVLLAFGFSVAWLVQAEDRRFSSPRVLGLIVANGLVLVVYCSAPLVAAALTGGPRIP